MVAKSNLTSVTKHKKETLKTISPYLLVMGLSGLIVI